MVDFYSRRQIRWRRKCQQRFWRNVRRAKEMRDNSTASEHEAFLLLIPLRTRFYRQSILFGYIVDFYFPEANLAVEIDGSSHNGKERLDQARDKQLKRRGITTLRFPADLVFENPLHFQQQVSHFIGLAQENILETV